MFDNGLKGGGWDAMDFKNISNDELATMLNDIHREIKWSKNYGKPIKELTQKAEVIKKEILRRMSR